MEAISSDSESSNNGDDSPVECNHCNEVMVVGSNEDGATQLSNHLKHVCEVSPFYDSNNNNNNNHNHNNNVSFEESEGSLDSPSCNQENCRKALARMCIIDNQPFRIVEYQGFRKFMFYTNPMFILPSKLDVARDCMLIYNEEKSKLKEVLKDQTVSISTDIWTSVEDYSYLCLTAHWIDDNWVLRKKILNFCQVSNLDGVAIGKMVYGCLQEWGIERVFTVTVDDTLSCDGTIGYLKTVLKGPNAFLDCKYLHLRCGQIINLIVKDELEKKFESVSKIRNAVKYVCSSPYAYQSFKESVESLKIKCERKPCLDVEARWDSTFLMLETAEKYVAAFDRLQSIDNNYRSFFDDGLEDDSEGSNRKRKRDEIVAGAPQHEDWENARYLIDYVKIFFNLTKKVSGLKYTTSNTCFKEFLAMHAIISNMCLDADEKKKNMFLSIKETYDKHWDNLDSTNFVMHVAIVLDPRYKFHYLKFCFGYIYGKDSPKGTEVLDRVTKTLNELFNHYKMKTDVAKSQNTTVPLSASPDAILSDLEADYAKYLENIGYNLKTELEIYLTDSMERLDENFDVLSWWKRNSSKFPILSQMARDVFGMPIAFSTGGRVIDEYRSSLPPRTTQALVCAQNWIADIKDQGMGIDDLHEIQAKLENTEIDEFRDDFNMDGSDEDEDGSET